MKLLPLALSVSLAMAQPAAPQQPLPFSHKQHADTGLKCRDCHANPDPGESMGLPATAKCMACHVEIAKTKPAIQKLKAYSESKQPVPWVRVYQIPGFVWFSHRSHAVSGPAGAAACAACHGPVAERGALTKEVNLSMGTCMECHRKNEASIDCNLCHEAR